MKEIKLSDITFPIYEELIKRLIRSNTTAVVLGERTYLVNSQGQISLLGGTAMSEEDFNFFKLYLVNTYDPEHKLFE